MSNQLDIERVKGESQKERTQRERARQEATKEDRARRRALSAEEQVRRFGTGEDVGLETDGHRIMADENIDVGAGSTQGKRLRVLTLAEAMHRLGTIGSEEWQAAEVLREKIMALLLPSEGVSSYGLSPGRSDPSTKADRRGRVLTGCDVNWRTGDVVRGRKHNRSEIREAADLLYAMAGLETEEGHKVFDAGLAMFVVRSVTGNAVTLTEIGRARTLYTGEKQASAAGGTSLKEAYQRGAVYLGLAKGTDWDGKLRWLPK